MHIYPHQEGTCIHCSHKLITNPMPHAVADMCICAAYWGLGGFTQTEVLKYVEDTLIFN